MSFSTNIDNRKKYWNIITCMTASRPFSRSSHIHVHHVFWFTSELFFAKSNATIKAKVKTCMQLPHYHTWLSTKSTNTLYIGEMIMIMIKMNRVIKVCKYLSNVLKEDHKRLWGEVRKYDSKWTAASMTRIQLTKGRSDKDKDRDCVWWTVRNGQIELMSG